MSQALHRHYPIQHFSNTFADVFADSEKVTKAREFKSSSLSVIIIECAIAGVWRAVTLRQSEVVKCSSSAIDTMASAAWGYAGTGLEIRCSH